jgi:hypothetical protein
MTESEIGLISAGLQSTASALAGFQANRARIEANNLKDELAILEANRQPIINPYADVVNPYDNLAVATQAADMQIEQTDLALANTLDAIRQRGAGGATALAQAALRSKQAVSADLARQQVQNEKLRAQGEMQTQRMEAAGKQFVFEQQEDRELGMLNRAQAQLENQRAQQLASQAQAFSALGGATTSLGNVDFSDQPFGIEI